MKHRYLAPIVTLLAAVLLPSCGTSYCNAPYFVGVKAPRIADKPQQKSGSAKTAAPQDIYRIGSGFYSKMEVEYFPVKPEGYTWDCFRGATGIRLVTTAAPERATYYCRLSARECAANRLAAPTSATAEAAVLTADEAAALHPVYATTLRDAAIPKSCDSVLAGMRYSNSHYCMLPATAVVFVGVDIPCTIVGSLLFGLQATFFGF